jgi:hypothetical protein
VGNKGLREEWLAASGWRWVCLLARAVFGCISKEIGCGRECEDIYESRRVRRDSPEGREGMRGGEAQKERVREITAQLSTAIIKYQIVFNGYSVRTTL